MFKKIDPNFSCKYQGAICFCEWEGKILMLKRSPASLQGGLWTAAPGGKLETGETPLVAVVREVREETGIELEAGKLASKGCYLCSFGEIEYLLHIFYVRLSSLPTVFIDPKEHTEYLWATVEEAHQMPLMRGGAECLQVVFKNRVM